jgi:hypothetical protein
MTGMRLASLLNAYLTQGKGDGGVDAHPQRLIARLATAAFETVLAARLDTG